MQCLIVCKKEVREKHENEKMKSYWYDIYVITNNAIFIGKYVKI